LLAVNIAVAVSSSDSTTVPAAQLFVGFSVVAENAEYEECHTTTADAATPATALPIPIRRVARVRSRVMLGTSVSSQVMRRRSVSPSPRSSRRFWFPVTESAEGLRT
jgi:hypothetical protein